jgi:hypothetical protein
MVKAKRRQSVSVSRLFADKKNLEFTAFSGFQTVSQNLNFLHACESETFLTNLKPCIERGDEFVNIISRRIEHHPRANHVAVKPAFAD